MQLFAQISKVDEAKRLVFGIAAQETPDKSGEIMDYASSKPHFAKWSADVSKDTDGKSLGNLRAMHGKIAAGKLTALEFNDADKSIEVCAKVVDDNEWKKVCEGVYTGFSIGGSYVGSKTVEKIDGKDVTRYTAAPNELSLVDRPCIPSSKFFNIQKADGSLAKVDFKAQAEEPTATATDEAIIQGTPEEVDEFCKALNAGGLSMADLLKAMPDFIAAKKKKDAKPDGKDTPADDELDADGKPKAKPGDKKPDDKPAEKMTKSDLRKGMYACSSFAGIIASLQSLKTSAAYEAYSEGDDSPLPGRIAACIALCGQVLKEMIDEELAELTQGGDADIMVGTPIMAMAEKCGEIAKFEGEPILALLKAGARHSAADADRLKAIHDASVGMGADCPSGAAAKAQAAADLAKADTSALQKMIADAVAPLQKDLGDAQALIKKFSEMPAPARVALRAVSKADDLGGIQGDPVKLPVIVDDHGQPHEAASLIKSLHTNGGAPLMKHIATT